MYLSIADKVIDSRQEAVHALNKKIIEDYRKLPFWKKSQKRQDAVRTKVLANWQAFRRWMVKRIVKKQHEVDNTQKKSILKVTT